MNNKKNESEWKEIINGAHQTKNASSDDQLEIVVVDNPKPKIPAKQEALAFWINRVRQKKQEKVITIDDPLVTPSALNSPKIPVPLIKAPLPIVTHQKQKERSQRPQVISVQEESTKMNVQKYKKAIFRTEDKPKKPYVESQQSKKRRFLRQQQIIESMNRPLWQKQKEKRQQLNRNKYAISSVASYGYDHYHNTRGVDTFNEASWYKFQRQREANCQKHKEQKQEQRRKEKQKLKELKLQKKRQIQLQFLEFADGLLGNKKQKTDVPQPAQEAPPSQNANDCLKNAVTADEEQETIKNNIALQDGEIDNSESAEIIEPKLPRYGIKDIIKNNQSPYTSEVVRAVLAHNYAQGFSFADNKKIPDFFEDACSYKRTFHFLIANESISDVAQRMRKVEREGQRDPIKVLITNIKANSENEKHIELYLQEISQEGKSHALKNCSLSRQRIGLLTNQVQFKCENYGFSQASESFGMIVMLVTPESKDEMGSEVKVLGRAKIHQLQIVLRKRGSEAYFYDLDKLSTSYRQYLAISNIQHSQLAPIVFNPQLMQREMKNFVNKKDSITNILDHLKSIFNQTQWDSIREMVRKEKGIVLLQGPPGTGKTSTLMGILSAQYEYLKRNGDNRKIMICAPSNAAVDHIVKRLQKEGLFNGQGQIVFPNVLRVGIVETLDEDVRAVSLDDLCEKKMIQQDEKAKQEGRLTSAQIKEKLIAIQKDLRRLSGPDSDKQYAELKQMEIRYEDMLFTFRAQKVVTSRKHFSYFENQYLSCAQIILTTLSSSGNQKLDRLRGEIACLIIDEAAQATEPNLLIAFQTGVQKVMLIGDPYQLPATCMSSDCNVTLFNRSLFERFLDANIKPYFLNIQYRMAPLIRQFPSQRFYHGRLVDAASVVSREIPSFLECFKNRSVIFLDVKYGRQMQRGDSHFNEAEGHVVGRLVQCLLQAQISMGIITPYQAQRSVISRECKAELNRIPEEVTLFQKNVMINTVDSFQGQERDVIIVSTVRANSRQNLGFLTDQRRINVTLTRAKFLLVVVGHADTLGSNEVWNEFLNWVDREKLYYELQAPQDLKGVLANVFKAHNSKPISRRRYTQLSTDIRHRDRGEIYFNDNRVKKAQEKIALKATMQENHNTTEIGASCKQNYCIVIGSEVKENIVASKYALDIKESQKIREEKKLKEKQAEDFDAMNQRMKQMEEQMKKDNIYKDLF